MVSLMIRQIYLEILSVADEQGGKLRNRVMFYCDELGIIPPIESLELIFSASRSRRLMMVPIIQSFGQLQKDYGKEGSEIIIDNYQCTIFGGFAPNSQTAEVCSKALGSRTVMSGSISRGKNDPSQSLQMMECPLMMPDELKSLPKGQFIVMKIGTHPIEPPQSEQAQIRRGSWNGQEKLYTKKSNFNNSDPQIVWGLAIQWLNGFALCCSRVQYI